MSPDDSSLIFRHPSRRPRRAELRRFFAELGRRVAPERIFTCLIATDRDLRALNRRFRGKDRATDVLSFPSAEGGQRAAKRRLAAGDEKSPGAARALPAFLGEIAISLDRAAAQAAEYGHSLDTELRILMLHGVLHLTGLDHEKDRGEMAEMETRWRKKLGLPCGVVERADA
jgi:probable rRNA maturation factor